MLAGEAPGASRPFWDADSVAAFDRLVALIDEQGAGVAVLGTGLSMPWYPSWDDLYEQLRQFAIEKGASEDGLPERPRWGHPIALQSIATAIGEDVLFDQVRRIFAPNVASLPQAYTTLCSMTQLELVTWNIEEFLATAANHTGRTVSAYPDFQKHYAEGKVTYLHGRAAIATQLMDLVLGQRAYDHAYRDGGDLDTMLRSLFWQRPVVFIGTSLSDPVFLAALDRIRIRRAVFDGVSVGRIVPLRLFALMKAEGEAQVRSDTGELKARDITPIWYSKDDQGGHRELLHIFDYLKNRTTRVSTTEPPAADIIPLLNAAERLARVDAPTHEDEALATQLLANDVVGRAFFRAAPTEGWFPFLREEGYLIPAEPVPSAAGEWETEWWSGGEYLEGLARAGSNSPVVEFLSTLRTSNWLALSQVGRILRELPTREALALSGGLGAWLSTPFAAQSGLANDALRVLAAGAEAGAENLADFAEPILDSVFGEKEAPFGEHLARRLATDVLPQLITAGASRGVFIAARDDLLAWLRREWGDEPGEDASSARRPAIEAHQQNLSLRRLDYLVDIARDTLHAQAGAPDYADLLIETYGSAWPLLRRIALNEARTSARGFETLEDLIAADMSALMSDLSAYHELSLLVATRTTAPPSFVEALQQATEEGRPDSDPERRALWKRRWLHLTPDWMLTDAQLAEKRSTTLPFDTGDDSRFFLAYSSGVFRPTAPIAQADFDARAETLDDQGVLDLVRDPEQYGIEVTYRHDSEQMWDLLIEYVARSRRNAIPFLATATDIEGRGGWKVVSGALRSIETEPVWHHALEWLDALALARGTAAWAVSGALRDDIVERAPLVLLDEIVGLARGLIEREHTPLSVDSRADAAPDEYDDLMFKQLNTPAGQAAEALLRLTDRVRMHDQRDGMPDWLMTIAYQAAIDAWGGVEVRVALGSLFPVLRAVDQARADELKPLLLPPATGLVALNARVAFWTGYLYRGSVSSDDLRYLFDEYAHEFVSLSLERLEGEPQSRLVDHIIVGRLRGIAGFEAVVEDVLSTPESLALRSRLAESFGRFLGERENILPALAYWGRHLELWGDSEDLDTYFGWLTWLGESQEPTQVELVLSLIARTVRPTPPEHRVMDLLEYLKGAVDEEPNMVLLIVARILDQWAGASSFQWFTREAVAIVLALAETEAGTQDEYRVLVQGLLASGQMTPAEGNTALGLQST